MAKIKRSSQGNDWGNENEMKTRTNDEKINTLKMRPEWKEYIRNIDCFDQEWKWTNEQQKE